MPWVERRSITRPERPREFYSAGVGSALSSGSRGLPSNSITSEDRGGGALQLILPNGVNERKSARATKLKLAGPRPGFQSGSRAPKVTRSLPGPRLILHQPRRFVTGSQNRGPPASRAFRPPERGAR